MLAGLALVACMLQQAEADPSAPGAFLARLAGWAPAGRSAVAQALADRPRLRDDPGTDACLPHADASEHELAELLDNNCRRVKQVASDTFQRLAARYGQGFKQRVLNASSLCASAVEMSVSQDATRTALAAWSTVLMGGRECCNEAGPPFCVSSDHSKIGHFTPFLIAMVVLITAKLAPFLCKKVYMPMQLRRERDPRPQSVKPPPVPVRHAEGHSGTASASSSGEATLYKDMKEDMKGRWEKQNSFLNDNPDRQQWGHCCADLFAKLQQTFGFQASSTVNQFENFVSLLRSSCSMVADKMNEDDGAAVDEGNLLPNGLNKLHDELLEGYMKYKAQLDKWEAALAAEAGGAGAAGPAPRGGAAAHASKAVLPALGNRWGITRDSQRDTPLSTKLARVAVYLLVWGEAGNVRFMPEILCFLTDLVLTANQAAVSKWMSYPKGRSGHFLVHAVRPIYWVVFNENYKEVKGRGKDKDGKALYDGFEKYLPADTANYDDWNELFCDPDRLVRALVLNGPDAPAAAPTGEGEGAAASTEEPPRPKLYKKAPEDRLGFLPAVDWEASLRDAKTHREVHSLMGLFAGIQRVVFLHVAMFCCTYVAVARSDNLRGDGFDKIVIGGNSPPVRLAAVGLLVPLHAVWWYAARWIIAGPGLRPGWQDTDGCDACWHHVGEGCKNLVLFVFWMSPIVTYGFVRYAEVTPSFGTEKIGWTHMNQVLLGAHLFVSLAGAFAILLSPFAFMTRSKRWEMTEVHPFVSAGRWLFWILVLSVKAWVGAKGIRALDTALDELLICRLGRESLDDLKRFAFSPNWDKDTIEWVVLTCTGLVLYVADTQFWFSLGCSFLGAVVACWQRGCREVGALAFSDLVADIPQRFSSKVLYFALKEEQNAAQNAASRGDSQHRPTRSRKFPPLWNKVVEYLSYEDKIAHTQLGELSYIGFGDQVPHLTWKDVKKPPQAPPQSNVMNPGLFRKQNCGLRWLRREACPSMLPDSNWPNNAEFRYRVMALSRALTLDVPRPFRTPYIPGITVLIPHYGESILAVKKDLFPGDRELGQQVVPLISWLHHRYNEEFSNFAARRSLTGGNAWSVYSDADWENELAYWASMRTQTLWRTVAGMTLYHQALEAHHAAQGHRNKKFEVEEVFRCMITMQMYPFFSDVQLKHTDAMLEQFESTLKIAFIDFEDKPEGEGGEAEEARKAAKEAKDDLVHAKQSRRYYSCLIDKHSKEDKEHKGRRLPDFKVELPGYPILGDGKGDNQNHAVPFTRGMFIQAIDANQGAYFEQMLLLPCVLGEFRARGDGKGSRKILGFPEHITSDFGSIGDFAAGAELAFGTVLQRSYAALGARMHYGHPDMMNRAFMMQQGGVSKATKTVNLSEDIFAGMDFTLRGNGRHIKHVEYFMVSKGRDLGFNTVLLFFSKLSAGTGEQVLTRQMARLAEQLNLPEFLTFYYAHGGFYLTQLLLSKCVPLLVYIWLLVNLDNAESTFDATDPRLVQQGFRGPEVMARLLMAQFGWVLGLFLLATTAPLFLEMWMQVGFLSAVWRLAKQMGTLAPLHFIFQAKVIGTYISNGILYGGASYVSTGRGLPTERRSFIGYKGKNEPMGLYNDFAQIALYDGARLFVSTLLVVCAGGLHVDSDLLQPLLWWMLALGMTIYSWLLAPFIFNPYQFAIRYFKGDLRALKKFFVCNNDNVTSCRQLFSPDCVDPDSENLEWVKWYRETQLKAHKGIRSAPMSVVVWLLFIASWYTVLNNKMHVLTVVFGSSGGALRTQLIAVLPPIFLSVIFCFVLHPLLDAYNARQPVRGELAIPMCAIAAIAVVLDGIEMSMELYKLMAFGWWKSLIAGVMLKYSWLSLLNLLCECLFRILPTEGDQPQGPRTKYALRCIQLWLEAHRMARDMAVSMLIFFLGLGLGVFFDWVRVQGCGCDDFSLHNLLVYRDAGHINREVQDAGNAHSRSQTFFETTSSRPPSAVQAQTQTFQELVEAAPPAGASAAAVADLQASLLAPPPLARMPQAHANAPARLQVEPERAGVQVPSFGCEPSPGEQPHPRAAPADDQVPAVPHFDGEAAPHGGLGQQLPARAGEQPSASSPAGPADEPAAAMPHFGGEAEGFEDDIQAMGGAGRMFDTDGAQGNEAPVVPAAETPPS